MEEEGRTKTGRDEKGSDGAKLLGEKKHEGVRVRRGLQ